MSSLTFLLSRWHVVRHVFIGIALGIVLSATSIGMLFIGLEFFGPPPTQLDHPTTDQTGLKFCLLFLLLLPIHLFLSALSPSFSHLSHSCPSSCSYQGVQTLTFCMLFYIGLGSIFSARERGFFFRSAPSWQFLLPIIIDFVVVFILARILRFIRSDDFVTVWIP